MRPPRLTPAIAAVLCTLALLLSACGDSPTAEDDDGRETSQELRDVVAAVEGLGPKAREAKLRELARAEGNVVEPYVTYNPRVLEPMSEGFEKKYGIEVKGFTTDPGPLLQRVDQETKAGRRQVDLVETGGPELQAMSEDGIFEPVGSPHKAGLGPDADQGDWTALRVNRYVLSWNTERVSRGEVPKSWEELAEPKWRGRIGVGGGTVGTSWYKTLYEYWTGPGGKSEEEANRLFEAIARNARVTSGGGVAIDLLAAGEFDVSAGAAPVGQVERLQADEAPVEWEPAIEPVIAQLQGGGVVRDAPHPAAAILFLDYLMTDGQDVLADDYREPLREDLREEPKAEQAKVDLKSLVADQERWAGEWDRLSGLGRKIADPE